MNNGRIYMLSNTEERGKIISLIKSLYNQLDKIDSSYEESIPHHTSESRRLLSIVTSFIDEIKTVEQKNRDNLDKVMHVAKEVLYQINNPRI